MENKNQINLISNIINNDGLRGSLYSSLKCSTCGKKLVALAAGEELQLTCPNQYSQSHPYHEREHAMVRLSLREIAAILNFNPLL